MKRIVFLSLSLMLAPAAYAQNSPLDSNNLQVYAQGANQPFARWQNMRYLEYLNVQPIFENLPFLKLRAGDQLLRAEVYEPPVLKGTPANAPYVWSGPSLHIKHEGKMFPVSVSQKDGKLLEPMGYYLPLFTWELTRANADALFQFLRPTSELSVEQLARLDVALQADFPEYLGDDLTPILNQPEKVSTGFLRTITEDGKKKFVYAGFTYDDTKGNIYLYHLILGQDNWLEKRAILISPPPEPKLPVDLYSGGGQGFTGRTFPSLASKPSSEPFAGEPLPRRRRLQAQIANRQKFFKLVREALSDKRP